MTVAFSLNEILALSKKAAKGAGYSWGMSEDAGRAARWLSARGLPGSEALLSMLEAADKLGVADLCPPKFEAAMAGDQPKCSLWLGTALMDRGPMLAHILPLELENVHTPPLLVAFLGQTSEITKQGFCVKWDDTEFRTGDFGVRHNNTGLYCEHAELVSISLSDDPCESMPVQDGIEIQDGVRAMLNGFAHRTYAPATEESRRRGAG